MISLPANISIANARLPQVYEAAKTALASCASIDECKDWADRAEALASYAKQADDGTLRKMADRIQARAIRRCGELLKTYDARGAHRKSAGSDTSSQRQAAEKAGLSKGQQVTAVRVANVSENSFNLAVECDDPATVTQIAEMGKKGAVAPAGFKEATKLLGTIRRFADFCEKHEPERIAQGLMDYEVAEARRMIGVIDGWLDRFVVNLGDVP